MYVPLCPKSYPCALHSSSAVQSDPEGALWRDPPHYWEQIVYPAYVEAHRHIFEGGDVEHGRVSRDDIGIINALEQSMGGIVERCGQDLVSYVEKAH